MAVHLGFLLFLIGLTGIHSITTVSNVSVGAGGSITIPCLYESKYKNHVKYLCKGSYWNSCSYAIKTNHRNSRKFSISDDKIVKIFTVTINHLTKEDTDYWCAVDINGGGDEGKYFKLSVTTNTPSLDISNQEITGLKGETKTINCNNRNSGEMKWCRLGGSCLTKSGSIDGTGFTINSVSGVFTVTLSGLRTESSGWYLCVRGDLQMPVHITVTEKPTTTTSLRTSLKPNPESLYPTQVSEEQPLSTVEVEEPSVSGNLKSFIIRLSLLIILAMVNLFIWFMFKRQEQTIVESSATTTAEGEVRYVRSSSDEVEAEDEEVTYSNMP
ncbi:hypothetical protein OYC64_012444 [Pagothenia borchgrevinki]|uniref:Immunoglobulin domain-containing protein n=1 Tax=Pagothenia borchgrevinki TaxID=8213 RepID=A0ABD2G9H9_PAGBO